MSKNVFNVKFTQDIGFFILISENKDDGHWWKENDKLKSYFDLSYRQERVSDNLKFNCLVFYIGKFAVCFYRFQNK